MKRTYIIAGLFAGVLGAWTLSDAWTHEGHTHNKKDTQPDAKKKPDADSNNGEAGRQARPVQRGPGCEAGFCRMGRGGVVFNGRMNGNRFVAPALDLKTLSVRLEYASQIVGEDIVDEFPRSRFRRVLVARVEEFQKATTRFRKNVDGGMKPMQLQNDIDQMKKAFVRLARPIQRLRRLYLVDRSMWRADRLLRQVAASAQPRSNDASKRTLNLLQPTPPVTKTPEVPKTMKGILQLPQNEQTAALAQRTCPVTGGLLGGHGKPLKVAINGKTIYVCCRGCIADLKANPAKYLK